MTVDHSQAEHEVIIVGSGWAGSIVAAELAAAGRSVTILERGTWPRVDDSGYAEDDQGRWPSRRLTQHPALETYTLRHRPAQVALPIRRLNSFWAGATVGGAGVLWGGLSPRLGEQSLRARSAHVEAFGPQILGPDNRLIDWPIDYATLEPDYLRFERVAGVAGASGSDPFAGPRSGPFPIEISPVDVPPGPFVAAAKAHGLHPHPLPLAHTRSAYTNSYGLTRGLHPTRRGSIATPLNSTLPFALSTGRVRVIEGARVRRVLHDGHRASGVSYVDSAGEHTLRAEIVVMAAWALGNVRLMLLSGIGEPYDPETEHGAVGRNHANHLIVGSQAYFDRTRHAESTWTTGGWRIADFVGLPGGTNPSYTGGVQIAAAGLGPSGLTSRPNIPAASPRWGAGLREAIARYQDAGLGASALGEVIPHRHRYLDLDPTYRDPWGDPLLRITFDWEDNERQMIRTVEPLIADVLRATGADVVDEGRLSDHYDVAPYQNSHATGGTIMGDDPAASVVDPDLRSWNLENLWIVGSSTFPTAGAPNPTATVGALAFRASRAIERQLAGAAHHSEPVHIAPATSPPRRTTTPT